MRQNPRLDCPRVNTCLSNICPLDPNINPQDEPNNSTCSLGRAQRVRIASKYEDSGLLVYGGLSKVEYYLEYDKALKKEMIYKSRERSEVKKKERADENERDRLTRKFRTITKQLPVSELELLVNDINSILNG